MITILTDLDAWAALFSLTALEIVLGIDNILFISILVSRCPPHQVFRARQIGLALAFAFRTRHVVRNHLAYNAVPTAIFNFRSGHILARCHFDWRRAFLSPRSRTRSTARSNPSTSMPMAWRSSRLARLHYWLCSLLPSTSYSHLILIITAIGMVDQIGIMIAAVLVAMIVMFFASGHAASFVSTHPTIKMLALAFLLLIGMALIADGFDVLARGYIYFAMAFASAVELFMCWLGAIAPRDLEGTQSIGFFALRR